jgi:hypothetical protein
VAAALLSLCLRQAFGSGRRKRRLLGLLKYKGFSPFFSSYPWRAPLCGRAAGAPQAGRRGHRTGAKRRGVRRPRERRKRSGRQRSRVTGEMSGRGSAGGREAKRQGTRRRRLAACDSARMAPTVPTNRQRASLDGETGGTPDPLRVNGRAATPAVICRRYASELPASVRVTAGICRRSHYQLLVSYRFWRPQRRCYTLAAHLNG